MIEISNKFNIQSVIEFLHIIKTGQIFVFGCVLIFAAVFGFFYSQNYVPQIVIGMSDKSYQRLFSHDYNSERVKQSSSIRCKRAGR